MLAATCKVIETTNNKRRKRQLKNLVRLMIYQRCCTAHGIAENAACQTAQTTAQHLEEHGELLLMVLALKPRP